MSKNAHWPNLKKPLAFTSSRALSSMFADRNAKFSPVTGCRAGSVATSLHTCDSKAASRSRISSWRECTKPPFLQSRACTVLKGRPQGHVLGKPDIDLLYRNANASLNSCFLVHILRLLKEERSASWMCLVPNLGYCSQLLLIKILVHS